MVGHGGRWWVVSIPGYFAHLFVTCFFGAQMFGTNVQALLRVKSKVKYAGVWCILFSFFLSSSRLRLPDAMDRIGRL